MSLRHIDTLISFALVMLLLSLLVTTLVEAVNLFLNARGRNLGWGVERVLQQFGFTADDARTLAWGVLKHPSLLPPKWMPWVRASALRAEELAMLANELLKQPQFASIKARSPLAAAGIDNAATWLEKSSGARVPQERIDAVERLAKAVGYSLDKAPSAAPALAARLELAVNDTLNALELKYTLVATQLTNWFNTTMDRTTERFVSQTRNVTVLMAALTVLTLHIDAIRLVKRLSADDGLRTALVESAAATVDDAGAMIEELDRGKSVADQALQSLAVTADARVSEASKVKLAAASVEPQTRAGVSSWVAAQIAESERTAVLELFEPQFRGLLEQRQEKIEALRKDVVGRLEATQLDIFGGVRDWPSGFCRDAVGEAGTRVREFDSSHLVGMVIAVLFLSLGAPFWFNTLRNLSNLRPIVARKVEQSQQGSEG